MAVAIEPLLAGQAKAGRKSVHFWPWIPAFAGMTNNGKKKPSAAFAEGPLWTSIA